MRPSGKIEADGQLLQFRVIRTPGDGDCGCTVSGIPREEAADASLKLLTKTTKGEEDSYDGWNGDSKHVGRRECAT